MRIRFFQSASDFRRWLDAHHRKDSELWVGFHKQPSGKPSITYPEAVEQALCYGWIDGLRKTVDTNSYTIRFTPRKPASRWSAINIKRAQTLADAGQMRAAGLKVFERAQDQRHTYSYEQRRSMTLEKTSERLFRANRQAWEFFQAQPPWYRRTSAFWIISAKKEATRQRRLSTLIRDSQNGKWIKPLRRAPVPRRDKRMR